MICFKIRNYQSYQKLLKAPVEECLILSGYIPTTTENDTTLQVLFRFCHEASGPYWQLNTSSMDYPAPLDCANLKIFSSVPTIISLQNYEFSVLRVSPNYLTSTAITQGKVMEFKDQKFEKLVFQ